MTKFVEIRTQADARKVTETFTKSLLVKCSFNGSNPNNLMKSFFSDAVTTCESLLRQYENTNTVERIEDIARDMGTNPVSVYNVAGKTDCKRPSQYTKLAGRKRKA